MPTVSRSAKGSGRAFRWPNLLTPDGRGIAYGGDYNPEQWPEETWDDDIRLMKEAGVNVVALAIFSWGRIQPDPQTWDFDWLDRIVEKLGKAGIAVNMSSATATAPMWLYQMHPEVLPLESDGTIVHPGSRQSWSPSSPVFRKYALSMCRKMAEHYKDNPYVVSWHVGNEYGWNNRHDYSPDSQYAFRQWCKARYGTIEAVNEAWGTAFWSQQVRSFDQIQLPMHPGDDVMINPGLQLDFERFGSDALKDFFAAERDAIAEICPGKPLTTNFMVAADQCVMDYADWSDEVDFVSNDQYFEPGAKHLDALLCGDALVDSISLRLPWYLMEHSTSAVQWKPVNARKRGGELIRDALAHVAMGADAINFFQVRQSEAGSEAFHSAMIPHAGEQTKIFREVCELGEALNTLSKAGLQGSKVEQADTAILFDAQSQWATECKTLPTRKLSHLDDVSTWYSAFLDAGHRADVVPLRGDFSGYTTIVLPTVLSLSDQQTQRIERFVARGGTVIVGYATGLVDEDFHVGLGGYPGAGNGLLRKILGVSGEEFNILGSIDGEYDSVQLSNGAVSRLWQTVIGSVADCVTVLASYQGDEAKDWELEGMPAITRNGYGKGRAYYIGCDLDRQALASFLRRYLRLGMTQTHSGAGVDNVEQTTMRGSVDALDNSDAFNACSDLVHIRRNGEGFAFDFYLTRGRQPVRIDHVDGEVVFLYRGRVENAGADRQIAEGGLQMADGEASVRAQAEDAAVVLERNGILITRQTCGDATLKSAAKEAEQ
ncbi:beta-galactosidase [Bifidobacterium sp. ESL0800]|uniref:beta-galactosidase n=1 Tax=Bifidobacterium sp. ESL0800 TaxID=2983236 RepID=UPI0023F61B6E|nr:beta-galactosidase [Bifidobacterium sp. ESL0800]WEV75069.1 beta-galactosidase [Bifidobacterium sp. ESL0800]